MRKKILLSALAAGILIVSGCSSDSPGIVEVKKEIEAGRSLSAVMEFAVAQNKVDGMKYLHEEEGHPYFSSLYPIAIKNHANEAIKVLYDNNIHISDSRSIMDNILRAKSSNEIIKLLSERGLDISNFQDKILKFGTLNNDIRFLDIALKMKAPVTQDKLEKLFFQHLELMTAATAKFFIERGVDPTNGYYLNTVVYKAKEEDNQRNELFSFLVDQGAKINSDNLKRAIQTSNNVIVQKMISKGIKFNQRLLTDAFLYLNAKTVLLAVAASKNLDINKAMYRATSNDKHGIDILKKVVASGIALNQDCLVGIYEQSLNSNKKDAWQSYYKELIEAGADINHLRIRHLRRGEEQRAVLHIAAYKGDIEMLKYLDSKKAAFNLTGKDGWRTKTALDFATKKFNPFSKQKDSYYSDTIKYLYQNHAKDIVDSVSYKHVADLISHEDISSLEKLSDAGLSFKSSRGKPWDFGRYADENKVEMYTFLTQHNLI